MKVNIKCQNIIGVLIMFCGLLSATAVQAQSKSYKPDSLETIFEEVDTLEVVFEEVLQQRLTPDSVVYEYTEGYDEDEGAENEEDILYASFDNNTIHYPKVDFSNKKDTTPIPLVNPLKGQVYAHPAESYRISSRFGPRRRRFHYGIDLAMPTGTPIYSTFDGVIRVAKFNKSYGNLVVIRHDNGLETYYAHLSKIQVECGQKVKAGEQIGLAGNTGRSYGSHLHFETRYLGAAINPDIIIDFSEAGHKLKSDTLMLTASCFRKKASNQYASSGGGGGATYYKVRKGDTLGAIARRNGTTVANLCRLNGLRKNSIIRPGQRLKLR